MSSDLQKLQQKWNWNRVQILGASANLHRVATAQGKDHIGELLTDMTTELLEENNNYYRKQGVTIK